MRVLTVDDSAVIRKIIKGAAQVLDLEVVEAEDGLEAFEVLEKYNCEIDLILLDWNMPKMTGFEVLQKVKQDDKYKHIPVMMITTESHKENIIEAIQAGAANYMTKPFTMDELTKRILECIPDNQEQEEVKEEIIEDEGIPKVDEVEMPGRCFAEALMETIATTTGFSLEEGVCSGYCAEESCFVISGAMVLYGKENAMLTISTNKSSAALLLSYMTGTEIDDIQDSELYDGIAEVANMVAGAAKLKLDDFEEYRFNLSPPFTIIGSQTQIVAKKGVERYCRKFSCDEIQLGIKLFYF